MPANNSDIEVDPDDPASLDSLSILTGIDRGHLEMLANGDALPGEQQERALRRVLGRQKAREFARHDHQDVSVEFTRAGSLPEGTTLTRVKVEDLVEGDRLRFVRESRSGDPWVAVASTHKDKYRTVRILLDNGAAVSGRQGTLVSVARKA